MIQDLFSLPPLHRAAGTGDVAEMIRLLGDTPIESRGHTSAGAHERGPAVERDLTPLMVAAGVVQGSVEAVRALLERGADPRAVSAAGVDALWYAAGTGDPQRVAVLLEAGGRPDGVSSDGRSAVAVAAAGGAAEALRLLLEAGASPHPPEAAAANVGPPYFGGIPLFAAAAAGSAAGVQLLLEAGAKAAVRDRDGNTALMFAGAPEVVPLLAAGCPHDGCNLHGTSALHSILCNRRLRSCVSEAVLREGPEGQHLDFYEAAVQRRQTAVVNALLEAGVDPEVRDNDGRTALLAYCLSSSVQEAVVRMLVAHGATVHVRDAQGQTALHIAAQNRSQSEELNAVIRLLIEAGLPVDVRDNRQQTPLHYAAARERGNRLAIPVLLDLGADSEAGDADGMTPLLLAAGIANNSFAMVRCLLDRGADRRGRTPDGRTARDIAAQRVAELEKLLAAPDPGPGEPRWGIAERRLNLRLARLTLKALEEPGAGTPAADAPTRLPEPIWLGYRPRHRLAPHSVMLQTRHVEEVCNYGHGCWTEGANHAGCFPTLESVPEGWWDGENGQRAEVHAYRAIPLLFDSSGAVHPLTAEELLGPDEPAPEVPDLTQFRRLGYDVSECTSRSSCWAGCSPLSPYCNGMYEGISALINRSCLVDDLAVAYDLAVLFGLMCPEPGPYVIVEVWRVADHQQCRKSSMSGLPGDAPGA
jgi:ankyrin repeat protein